MKKILKIGIAIFTTLFTLILLSTISKAASFNASISSTTVKVGDTFTVTVNANNAAGMYSVSASNSNVSKTSGDSAEFLENGSTTITYKAVKAGSTTITAKATDMTDLDDDKNKVTGSKTFTVNITDNSSSSSGNSNNSGNGSGGSTSSGTANTKASITKVVINGITVKKDLPVTNKDSVTVSVTTSNGEGLKIYNSLTKKTISADSGKAVTVPIMEGTNTLTITLNSGATATRKIYSQKEEETPGNFIEEPQEDIKVLLKSLSIKSVKSEEEEAIDFKLTPEFSSEIYEYSIIIPEEYNDITKLDIEALASQDDFTVEITGNENLIDGENIVTILVKSKDGEKSATYKIIVNKEAKAVETVAEPVEDVPQTISEEENNSIKITKIAIVVFTSIVAILGIIFAIVEYMYGKKHNNEEEIGTIPYSSIGFEKEEKGKEDILEDLREDDEDVQEDEKPKRKGKHF